MRLADCYVRTWISNGEQLSSAATRFNRSREIPIGPDLYKVLRRYHTTNHRKDKMNAPHFFLTKEGNALKERCRVSDISEASQNSWYCLAMMAHAISLGCMI